MVQVNLEPVDHRLEMMSRGPTLYEMLCVCGDSSGEVTYDESREWGRVHRRKPPLKLAVNIA